MDALAARPSEDSVSIHPNANEVACNDYVLHCVTYWLIILMLCRITDSEVHDMYISLTTTTG